MKTAKNANLFEVSTPNEENEEELVQLNSGQTYWDSNAKEKVVLKWVNSYPETGKAWAVVHPVGEPDMQSCYGIELHYLKYI